MSIRLFSAAVLVSTSLMIGCDDSKTSQPQPATPPAAQPAKTEGQGVGGAAMNQAQKVTEGAKTEAAKITEGAKTEAAKTAETGTAAAGTTAAQAETQLQQVMDYIKQNKLDLAEQALAKLEASKASLPAAVQSKLPTARQALDTAKASGGKLPSVPGLK